MAREILEAGSMKRKGERLAAGGQPDRRRFLTGAALGGAGAIATPLMAKAQAEGDVAAPAQAGRAPPLPNQAAEQGRPPAAPADGGGVPGSDYMVDVMRALGIEYVAAIPGNTFKGLHESVINYGMLTSPKLDHVTCMHEEQSVAICHGYAKVAGKPMACMMHSTVGLQHGSMALYNAWADHAPVFAITGHQADAVRRGSVVDWTHSVYDGPALVRDFTKFDDTPASIGSFAEGAVRAYKFAMTPPYGPVLLALDQNLQEEPIKGGVPPIPRLPRVVPPQGEDAAVNDVAKLLVEAENPVILVDRCARTPAGVGLLVALAEALQAPVCDSYGRFNFPWRHPLAQTPRARALLAKADLVLGLEMSDFHGASAGAPQTARRISISAADLYLKSNYQDFERFTPVDIAVAADAEATLPALTEAVLRQTPAGRRAALAERGRRLAEAHANSLRVSKAAAAVGWDDQPITTARLCMELYGVMRNEDWSLVNGTVFQNYWPQQLWTADKHHQYIGDAGAYGLGYLPGASIGAALANQKHGRLTVAIGGDGDLMFSPGVLWAMAHNNIPLLYVVHNNRGYHQELMWVQQVANRRNRGIDRCHIGNTIDDPNVDFCKMAQALGVYAEKAVTDPADLAGAFRRAVAAVKRGQPALVDVVAQGR
jgi:thiamine pyrophosphate-dependent acetolactate synthase large subunit-like protein